MIFSFSGTGNTRAIAQRLAQRLGDTVVDIDSSMSLHVDITGQKRIIWCFPILAWDMPRIVRDVIGKIKIKSGENVPHFMVATCGDDAGLTHHSWRTALKKRGWNAVSAFTVIMPNTYVLLPGFDVDPLSLRAKKIALSALRVDEIAHAIKCQSDIDSVTEGKMPWLKSRILSPLFKRFLMSPKPFHADDRCIKCGKCVAVCPMQNISMTDSTQPPRWHTRCTLCLGCYHVCPLHAVAYGKITASKGQSYLTQAEADSIENA